MHIHNTFDTHVKIFRTKFTIKSVNIAWNIRTECKEYKQLSDYFWKFKVIYVDCNYCLQYTKLIKKELLYIWVFKEWERTYLVVDYFISKFPIVLEYWKKYLKNFILILRKGVKCYEYIDSRYKYNETSIQLKQKLFSKLKNK